VACPVAASLSRGLGFPTEAVDLGIPAFVANHLDVVAAAFVLEDPHNLVVVVAALASSVLVVAEEASVEDRC
jgi:hypothetical protein